MSVTTPSWLAQRGGELRPCTIGQSWFVVFAGEPQYKLAATPVTGKYGCRITQTINGSPVASASTGATVDEAIHAGLEDLRQTLGW